MCTKWNQAIIILKVRRNENQNSLKTDEETILILSAGLLEPVRLMKVDD